MKDAEEIYLKIYKAYGAYWPDTKAEKAEAIVFLNTILKQGISEDLLLKKAEYAAKMHGEKRCKVSLIIGSRYWETQYPCEAKKPALYNRVYNYNQI